MRNDVLLILFNLFGGVLGLLSLAMMLLIIWFVIAVGIPMRDWLQRELAKDSSTVTG